MSTSSNICSQVQSADHGAISNGSDDQKTWREYNDLLDIIAYDCSQGKIDHLMIGAAIEDCRAIIADLGNYISDHPDALDHKGALEVKQNELRWLEEENKCLNRPVQKETLQNRLNFAAQKADTQKMAKAPDKSRSERGL